jgi:hypothetical protein
MTNFKDTTTQRAKNFITSPEGIEAHSILMAMVNDEGYKTVSTYSPSSADGNLLFIDKHMNYLSSHTAVNAGQYVSNLKLITKIR